MALFKKMIPAYILALALAFALASAASRSVTVLAAVLEPPEPTPITVVLDPGHGGEDGGAVAPDGVKESLLNLEISLRLRDLCRFLGVSAVMTREEDRSIYSPEAETVSEKKVSDLRNRVRLTEQISKPLLVSIHQNMFSQPRYDGAQVFYAPTAGSRELAQALQEDLRLALDPENHRQAKPAQAVYLLQHIHCPGVLIECGFLSNPGEEGLLQTPEYQRKIAAAVALRLLAWTCQAGAA